MDLFILSPSPPSILASRPEQLVEASPNMDGAASCHISDHQTQSSIAWTLQCAYIVKLAQAMIELPRQAGGRQGPRFSIRMVILGSFVLVCPTQLIFTNTESAMLSRQGVTQYPSKASLMLQQRPDGDGNAGLENVSEVRGVVGANE